MFGLANELFQRLRVDINNKYRVKEMCCGGCSLAARGSEGGPGKKPREPGPQDPLLADNDAP